MAEIVIIAVPVLTFIVFYVGSEISRRWGAYRLARRLEEQAYYNGSNFGLSRNARRKLELVHVPKRCPLHFSAVTEDTGKERMTVSSDPAHCSQCLLVDSGSEQTVVVPEALTCTDLVQESSNDSNLMPPELTVEKSSEYVPVISPTPKTVKFHDREASTRVKEHDDNITTSSNPKRVVRKRKVGLIAQIFRSEKSKNRLKSKYEELMAELEKERCSICLYDLVSLDNQRKEHVGMDNVLLLPCGHAIHDKCISEWLLNHVDCPICRQDLESTMASSDPYGKQITTNKNFWVCMSCAMSFFKYKILTCINCTSSGTNKNWFCLNIQALQWLYGRRARE